MEDVTPPAIAFTPASCSLLIHEFVSGGGLAGHCVPGSLLAEGSLMRQALAQDFSLIPGVRVGMTLDRRLTAEPGPWSIHPVGPGEEISALRSLASQVDYIVLVAPETGGVLAERAAFLLEFPAHAMLSTTAAIQMTSDKSALHKHLARQGIPAPICRPVFRLSDLPASDEFPYPAVIKPFDGAGCQDTFVIASPETLPPGALDHLPALLQTFHPGIPMSASFLVDRSGEPFLVGVGRQRMELRKGRFQYLGGTVPDGSPYWAAEAALALKTIPGLYGWVGVDFLWDQYSSSPTLLEINPRITTSYVGLRQLLPSGSLSAGLLALSGRPVSLHPREFAGLVHGQPPISFNVPAVPQLEEALS